jgi:dihydroorotate dehydrogenase
MYSAIRRLLFHIEAEQAHAYTLQIMRWTGRLTPIHAMVRRLFAAPPKPVDVFGLRFANPVGLAAGYDKDGLGWRGLACLGFGHIEIGTITPLPQDGNPPARVFRLSQDQALINRLGFPNRGAQFIGRQLQGLRPPGVILGANLGKNKSTPLENAAQDYQALVKAFAPLVDYLAINVSSPNTQDLRRLQARAALQELLTILAQERKIQEQQLNKRVPILVKLAPDLSDQELEEALDAIIGAGMDGVIAANTTLSRDGLCSPQAIESGGLSGAPVRARSTAMVRKIHNLTEGKLPIVGVGGIMSATDALEKLDAGAVLVQIYTGLVYAGPGLVRQIVRAL